MEDCKCIFQKDSSEHSRNVMEKWGNPVHADLHWPSSYECASGSLECTSRKPIRKTTAAIHTTAFFFSFCFQEYVVKRADAEWGIKIKTVWPAWPLNRMILGLYHCSSRGAHAFDSRCSTWQFQSCEEPQTGNSRLFGGLVLHLSYPGPIFRAKSQFKWPSTDALWAFIYRLVCLFRFTKISSIINCSL